MATPDEIADKLDVLIRLTALEVLGDRAGAEAIGRLARAGLSTELIAEIVGASPATVRSALSRARRSGVPT